MSKFRGTSKMNSPYEKFYSWATDELIPMGKLLYKSSNKKSFNLPEGKTLNVTAFCICEEDLNKLRLYTIEWLNMFHGMSKQMAKRQEMYFSFELAPSSLTIMERPKSFVPGYLYVYDNFLMDSYER